MTGMSTTQYLVKRRVVKSCAHLISCTTRNSFFRTLTRVQEYRVNIVYHVCPHSKGTTRRPESTHVNEISTEVVYYWSFLYLSFSSSFFFSWLDCFNSLFTGQGSPYNLLYPWRVRIGPMLLRFPHFLLVKGKGFGREFIPVCTAIIFTNIYNLYFW